jgi:hypothetical protein
LLQGHLIIASKFLFDYDLQTSRTWFFRYVLVWLIIQSITRGEGGQNRELIAEIGAGGTSIPMWVIRYYLYRGYGLDSWEAAAVISKHTYLPPELIRVHNPLSLKVK